MSQFEYKEYYRRNLPHLAPPGATFFVTYRLAGSIPKSVIAEYRQKKEWLENETKQRQRQMEMQGSDVSDAWHTRFLQFRREWFAAFEEQLHQAENGPHWLREEAIAQIVVTSLHFFDGQKYRLHAYCVMSNNVHVVLTPFLSNDNLVEGKDATGHTAFTSTLPTLAKIMHSLKSYTAKEANKVLQRTRELWEHESYDHYIRDEAEFQRIVKYVLQNPVKARLVDDWQAWPWSYCAST